jgi:SAM-dependent methyltransferase
MDLRRNLGNTIESAKHLLNYQPFILSDTVETGAGYSWIYGGDPRVSPPLVLDKTQMSATDWSVAVDANARARKMYDDQLDEIARRFPGATLLDVACNNGYFPVGAELRGLKGTGMDYGDYSKSVAFLNKTLKTSAKFVHAAYDSRSHTLPSLGNFDVTVMSAIVCHLPDPLNFLAAVAKITTKALLFWGQIVNSSALFVSLQPPHENLSDLRDFPHSFNDNTRISRGLFELSIKRLGFREIIEIAPREGWLKQLHSPLPFTLEEELTKGSRHHALLAIR